MKALGDIAQTLHAVHTKTQSPIEALMLTALLRNKHFVLVMEGEALGAGLFVYPQMEVGPYVADFIITGSGYPGGKRIWPPKKQLSIAVECDGLEFHSSEAQRKHDNIRDAYFSKQGIKTFRFSGSEIYRSGDGIAKDLADYLYGELFKP